MRTEKKNKDNNADSFFVILMCNAYGIQVERTVETQRERKRIISKSTTNTSNRTLYIQNDRMNENENIITTTANNKK